MKLVKKIFYIILSGMFVTGCGVSTEKKIQTIENNINDINEKMNSCINDEHINNTDLVGDLINLVKWSQNNADNLQNIKYSQAYSDQELDNIQNKLNDDKNNFLDSLKKYNDSTALQLATELLSYYDDFAKSSKTVRDNWDKIPGKSGMFIQGYSKPFMPTEECKLVNHYAKQLLEKNSNSLNEICKTKYNKTYDELKSEKEKLETELKELNNKK